MAGRDPWTMRNSGILGGLFPDDGQDLAFRDLAPLGEPAWAQATRDLMARSAQGSSAARDYPIPSQPAPWFPSAPSATNTWPAPSQPTTDAYSNGRAQGQAWLRDSAGNPPPLLHELPYFASDPTLPRPWATPMPNSQVLGSDNRLSPESRQAPHRKRSCPSDSAHRQFHGRDRCPGRHQLPPQPPRQCRASRSGSITRIKV